MLDLLGIIYFTYIIGKRAEAKGLPVFRWRLYHVAAWILFEMVGVFIGFRIIGRQNFIELNLFAVFCAFGGYLLIKYLLDKKPYPHQNNEDSIDNE
jgi:hypothetical protein